MSEFFAKVWATLKPWLAATWMSVSGVPLTWYVTALLCIACFFAGCSCRADARDPAAACVCPGCACQKGQPCACGPACLCSYCPGKPAPALCTLVVKGVEAVDFEVGGVKYKANGKARRLVTPVLKDVGHYDFVCCTEDKCVTGYVTVIPGATVVVTLDMAAGSLGSVVAQTQPPPLSTPPPAARGVPGSCPGGVCPVPARRRW